MLWKCIFWFWHRFARIDTHWFFRPLSGWHKNLLLVFIKGDMLLLLPLLLAIFLLYFISLKLMLAALGSYIAIRYLGEMIYWILEQKKPKAEKIHRPYDFGFKNLDNHALYIVYQQIAIVWMVFGVSLFTYSLLYLELFN